MAATNRCGPRYFITTNYMMSDEYVNQYFDYRVTGGKPAAASGTDRSMVCTAEMGNSRYLLVVMSAQSQVSEDGLSVISFGNFTETKKLMNFAFNGYTVRQVLDQDQAMYQYAVQNGQNDVVLHPAEDVWVLLPAGYDKNAVVYHNVVEASALKAPIAAEDQLGWLQISYNGMVLTKCALLAMNPSPEMQSVIEPLDRIPQTFANADTVWDWLLPLLVIGTVIIALLALLVVLIIKFIRNLRIRRRQTQRARKRKRSY
jgi:D-alanyl-D-alanine carboxypeptidase